MCLIPFSLLFLMGHGLITSAKILCSLQGCCWWWQWLHCIFQWVPQQFGEIFWIWQCFKSYVSKLFIFKNLSQYQYLKDFLQIACCDFNDAFGTFFVGYPCSPQREYKTIESTLLVGSKFNCSLVKSNTLVFWLMGPQWCVREELQVAPYDIWFDLKDVKSWW